MAFKTIHSQDQSATTTFPSSLVPGPSPLVSRPSPLAPRSSSLTVRPGEAGYTLVAVMFLLFLLTLSLTVAAPRMAREIQRDREVETMQRGKQYIRALRLYYRKFNAYPPSVDALLKTQNIRFLRKKYVDPISGKDDWKPIHFGENKAPTAMGFFGQPLTGSTLAGTGPSGGNGIAGASSATSSFFSSSSSSATGSSLTSANSTITNSGNSSTQSGSTSGSSSDSSSGSDSNFGSNGSTFGGGGIIGFAPVSSRESMLVYKTKNHYNEWEFVYDPIIERLYAAGGAGLGTAASSLSSQSQQISGNNIGVQQQGVNIPQNNQQNGVQQ